MRAFIFAGLTGYLVLFGVGCTTPSTNGNPLTPTQPINQLLDQRPIPQFQGFGMIPTPAVPPKRPTPGGTVRIEAPLPTIPTNVTVLRVKDGRPSDLHVRNITSSLNIPTGVLGTHPLGKELSLRWQDDQDRFWQLTATERKLEFYRATSTQKTLTVSTWPSNTTLINTAMAFLRDRGIPSQYYGSFYIQPDWNAWWQSEQANGRCMTKEIIHGIRDMGRALNFFTSVFPLLPEQKNSNCATPEFPFQAIVHVNATQDGQIILHADGSPDDIAELLIDVTTMQVIAGWLTIPADPDRSDYPAITLEEARAKLLRGGQGGIPNGNVTINALSFEWFKILDTLLPPTEYLYPALIGRGEITYADNRTAPYRIVVPLIKNEPVK